MLFVLVTLAGIVCAWAAYQLNWIRQRHEFLATRQRAGHNPPPHIVDDAELPWSLRLFGEKREFAIWVDQSDYDRAIELFPEAAIIAN